MSHALTQKCSQGFFIFFVFTANKRVYHLYGNAFRRCKSRLGREGNGAVGKDAANRSMAATAVAAAGGTERSRAAAIAAIRAAGVVARAEEEEEGESQQRLGRRTIRFEQLEVREAWLVCSLEDGKVYYEGGGEEGESRPMYYSTRISFLLVRTNAMNFLLLLFF